MLSERRGAMGAGTASASSDSDVLALVDRLDQAPAAVRQVERELTRLGRRLRAEGKSHAGNDDESLRKALLAGYPDRVAHRREAGSPRLVLASGHGAVLGRESGVREGAWLVALDVTAGPPGPGSEALVRVASRIDREWLRPTGHDVVHRFEAESGAVRAVERDFYLKLVLVEPPIPADPEEAGPLLLAALRDRGLGESARAV